MYYPILRAKQFELIAIRELASNCPSFFKIFTPIFEPVSLNFKPLIRTIESLNKIDVIPLLIINPTVGKLAGTTINFEEFQQLSFVPTIEFNSNNELAGIEHANKLGIDNIAALTIDGCSNSTLKALAGLKLLIVNTDIVQATRYQRGLNTNVVSLKMVSQRKTKTPNIPKGLLLKVQ